MLTEIYIEALLDDEELADQVWELWNAKLASDELAAKARWLMAGGRSAPESGPLTANIKKVG